MAQRFTESFCKLRPLGFYRSRLDLFFSALVMSYTAKMGSDINY